MGWCVKAPTSWPPRCPPNSGSPAAPGMAPRAAASTTGPASSWPRRLRRGWPGGCWCAPAAATGSWPSPPAPARPAPPWSGWSGGRDPLGGRRRLRAGQGRGRPGPLRGRQVAGLVSPHHPGPAGPTPSWPSPEPRPPPASAQRGIRSLRGGLGLLPLTVPEVRRLLVALVWTVPVEPGFVLAWSRWRRRHQARARRAHYRRREQQLWLES